VAAFDAAHTVRWWKAVELQWARIQGVDDADDPAAQMMQRELDAIFFVVALRDLLRLAEAVADDDSTGAVRHAIDAFQQTIPDAKNVRDVIEHFDEYSRGVGNLQQEWDKRRPWSAPTQGTVSFASWDGQTYVIDILVTSARTLTLDLRKAHEAASHLADAMGDFYDRSLARASESP
jgi:hypothetical protein